ncbi:hypothetical protein DEM25_000110 [Oceaniradius stylonematis]|uniref:Uncharacterized protein n=1 Tax=Oceaniradius stylonematis TaxID=2184161 RepID=A0A3A8ALF9_9HYPH|nr:hypothetical protein DEM25_000110 [Oceaniradius stylonematis]
MVAYPLGKGQTKDHSAQVRLPAFPEFPGVCEELHGEFEHFVEGMQRRTRFCLIFGDQQTFLFQSGDLLLVGRCDG